MFPEANWTVVAVGFGVGSALGTAVLGGICRRQRTALDEAGSRLDALADRVARLEARESAPGPLLVSAGASTASSAPVVATPTARWVGPPPAPDRDIAGAVEPREARAVIGPTLIVVPDLAASSRADRSEDAVHLASEELGRRFGEIWQLADAGTAADGIARVTGQPVGQIELILGLRRQRAVAGGSGAATGRSGPP